MNLPTEIFGDVIVVHTPEELGADQSEDFESYLPTLERNHVVLDLDSTEMLDSRGLTALLNAQEKLREAAGEIKIGEQASKPGDHIDLRAEMDSLVAVSTCSVPLAGRPNSAFQVRIFA